MSKPASKTTRAAKKQRRHRCRYCGYKGKPLVKVWEDVRLFVCARCGMTSRASKENA